VGRHPSHGLPLSGALVVRYRDDAGGTGVDPQAVRLRVGGRDLTGRAVVTAHRISLSRRLVPRGSPVVRLVLTDRAGNARAVRWRILVPGR